MSVTKKYDENLYIISDGDDLFVRAFLITGEDKNLLIDTGISPDGVFDEIRKISGKPVDVYLTHGDIDHAGGLGKFNSCHMHPADMHMINTSLDMQPVKEGDIVEAGGYSFEIISVPGHTNGSIAFFDKSKGILISGDTVQQNNAVFMFGTERNPQLYISSLKKLLEYKDQISVILPSHGDLPLSASAVENCKNDAEMLFEGNPEGEPHPFMPCRIFKGRTVTFFY